MFGYNREEFKIQPAIDNRTREVLNADGSRSLVQVGSGKLLKEKDPENNLKELQVYSYEHDEAACYYCMVSAKDASIEELESLCTTASGEIDYSKRGIYKYDERKIAYYRALAREKNNLIKISDYINTSDRQFNW